jgi:hypothetical protein
MFVFWDGIAAGRGPILNRLGRKARASWLCYGLASGLENLRETASQHHARILAKLRPRRESKPEAGNGTDGLQAFLAHADRVAAARGTRCLVLLLPQRDKGPGFYDGLRATLPAGVPVLDLHRELIADIERDGWIADGHYGAKAADRIARRIAREIESLSTP